MKEGLYMEKQNDKRAKEQMEFAKDQVIGAISETMDLYGVTPSVGKLYATMYFQGKMTLDEMRDELGMSKPSMSTSVRKLQKIGMVKKVFQRGSRKDTYTAEKDFFRSFTSFYCQMWEREVGMNMEAIEEAEQELTSIMEDDAVSDSIRAEAKQHFELLSHSKVYYEWLNRLVLSIRSGDIFEYIPKKQPESE